jgi:hypothetical protein
MAALPNVAKTVQVSLVHQYGPSPDVVTRFFVQYAGTSPDPTDLDGFGDSINAAWVTNVAPSCPTVVGLIQTNLVDLNSSTGSVSERPIGASGTRTGDELPADVSVVAAYLIRRRYRGGHPRGYWPFGVQGDLSTAVEWEDASVIDFLGSVTGFFTDVLAAGWGGAGTLTHVNVSYYEGFRVVVDPVTGRARNVPVVRTPPLRDLVTGVVVRSRIGTQRRRLGR